MCNISKRLLKERKRLELNQDKMAKIGGVAKRTYCNYEAGNRDPMGSFFTAIAKAGMDVKYILTGIQSVQKSTLTADERKLIDNYKNTDEMGKRIIKATAIEAAKSRVMKK